MRKTSEFDDQYRSARLQVFSQALARSQGASNIAIAVLLRIMTDSQESSHSRVRAALAVIKQAKEASELDMAQQRPSTGTDTSSRPDLSLLSDQELSTAYDIALIAKGKKAS